MTDTPKPGEADETLEVRYGGLLVGLLRRRSEEIQDIEFAYDQAWTKDPKAFAVSTRMPLTKRVHEPDECVGRRHRTDRGRRPCPPLDRACGLTR